MTIAGKLLARILAKHEPVARVSVGSLVPAAVLVPRFRDAGGGAALALTLTKAQVVALRSIVDEDAQWQRLQDLVGRAGDPWNADDWPDGFDALLLCAALCDHVSFECVRCAVGERQGGMSCAHPRSLFGRVLPLVMRGERDAVRDHLRSIEAVLRGEARWDPAREQLVPDAPA